MPLYAIDDERPTLADADTCFIAEDARVIGRVRLGRNVGVWFGAVVRGDIEEIVIGDDTNLQEHAIVHTDPGFPATIGRGCTIGHHAIVHGATVGDDCLIGMGAVVLNGARIGRGSLVGAGALVTEGKEFPENSLIVGSPAKVVRTLDSTSGIEASAARYVANAHRFRDRLKPL